MLSQLLKGVILGFLLGLWLVSEVLAEPFNFSLGNDFLIPNGRDRWLTNIFSVEYGNWAFGNEIYSPTNKKSEAIPYGDRNWDGYSYLQEKEKWPIAFGQERELISRIGFVGNDSGSKSLQRFVHDDLGLGQHPSWVGQNPSEMTADFILLRRSREYLQSAVGDSRLTQEYGARFGNVVDELFLDQELRKHFFKHLFIYGGLRGKAVAYNTHLDGRLFRDNVYTVDKQWFVAEGRLGFEYRTPEYWFSYTYKYLTEEFQGQDGRHLYGTFNVGFDW